MAIFFRGAGVDTYWHKNDARLKGFLPHDPGKARTPSTIINHIKNGTTNSPFVSLTRSYSIAWNYAAYSGYAAPTSAKPAYVYEIEIYDPLPMGLTVLDPIQEILKAFPSPLNGATYQHDGNTDFLMGIIDPRGMATSLTTHIKTPPPGGATPRPANLTSELETIVRALRDSELLAIGAIPTNCITNRYEVY